MNSLLHTTTTLSNSTPVFISNSSKIEPDNNLETKRCAHEAKMLELSDLYKIDIGERLLPAPVAMQIMDGNESIPLFTKGNFSIITGPPKGRKSYLISMLLASSIKGSFQGMLACPSEGTNILFDTEQSRHKTQQVTERICRLSEANNPRNLKVYSLRTLDPALRMAVIESVLKSTPNLNFVAIDGIIDLAIDPILQVDQAQMIVSKLMKWSEIYNIHITCVLHYNKNATTIVGHLGSISHRKADTIIKVTKYYNDSAISIVEPVDCREKEFRPFGFSIDQMGMPYILKDFTLEKRNQRSKLEAKPKSFTPAQVDVDTHKKILQLAFRVDKEHTYANMCSSIKIAIDSVTGKVIGDNKAKDFLTWYVNDGGIVKVDIPKKKTLYTIGKQIDLDFLRSGLSDVSLN